MDHDEDGKSPMMVNLQSFGGFLRTGVVALALTATGIAGALVAGGAAQAAEGHEKHILRQDWSFAGPLGTYDPAQLQRGFKIYKDVCSACHSLKYVAFRNLAQPGGPQFTEEEAKVIAAGYQITDGPNADGDMFERPGRLSDHFPSPFANEQAARASNGGALPPDMSLLAKARAVERGFPWFVFDIVTQYQESGPDYIYTLLNSFEEPPADVHLLPGQHYNPNFIAGTSLAMAPPLQDGLVEYTDGAPMTVDQYAKDVSAFLMWAAEPHLDQRKRIGLNVLIFLAVFAGALFLTKKRIWADAH